MVIQCLRRALLSIVGSGVAFALPALAGPWLPWGPSGDQVPPPAAAFHPRQPGDLMAAQAFYSPTHDTFTYGSADGGTTWPARSRFSLGTDPERVQAAMGGNYRYVLTDRFLRSQDGGIAWTPVDRYFTGVAEPLGIVGVEPTLGMEVILALGVFEILHSLDAGTSWQVIEAPTQPAGGAVDWETRQLYVVGVNCSGLISKSLDGGNVWTPGPAGACAVAASNGKALAVTDVLRYSPDKGLNWFPSMVAGSSFRAAAIAYAPTQPSVAYAVESFDQGSPLAQRVIRSSDGGATWTVVGAIPADGTYAPTLSVQAGAGDGLIVVGATTLRSSNGGATWTLVGRAGEFPGAPAAQVLFDATNADQRWIRGRTRTPHSADGGSTWTSMAASPIAASPARGGLVFGLGQVNISTGVLLRSIDGGNAFTPTNLQFSLVEERFPAVVAGDAPLEYFALHNAFWQSPPVRAVVYRSTDEGVTWNGAQAPPYALASFARSSAGPVVLYAGTEAPVGIVGLFKSTDHAGSWQAVPMGDYSGPVTALAVAPGNTARIYAGLTSAGGPNLVRSDDGGATWASAWIAMPTATITAIAVDPSSASRLFAGTDTQGVFQSDDAGVTWKALDAGLSDGRVRGLDLDPRDPTKLYASTPSGPYLADLSGGAPAGNRWAVEYYHAAFNHYFLSSDPGEIASLDAGMFEGWARTGESFRVGPTPSPDQTPVCRFFGVGFAPLSSHFFTPYPDECEIVMHDPQWLYEKIAFGLRLPETNKGCLPGYAPLYRLWNRNRGGAPNHRYTTSLATFDVMFVDGWVMEGEASTFVFACVPQ